MEDDNNYAAFIGMIDTQKYSNNREAWCWECQDGIIAYEYISLSYF